MPEETVRRLGDERFWNEVNMPFLDAAIARGDDIDLSTVPNDALLTNPRNGRKTFFGLAYEYLYNLGYRYNKNTGNMERIDI